MTPKKTGKTPTSLEEGNRQVEIDPSNADQQGVNDGLLRELDETRRSLLELKETLETRVEQRTLELEEANARLRLANTLFATLFQSSPIPTSLNRLDDWSFISVNQAYLDFFGVQIDQVLGKTAMEFGFAPGREARDRIRRQLEESGGVRHYELEVPSATGEFRTILASIQNVHLEGPDQVISSFMDITERVRAENKIRELASELTLAEQAERHRISRLLHDELQQRLFAIRMQLSLLKDDFPMAASARSGTNFEELDAWLGETIEMTRDLSIELSPLILQGEGLSEAINWLIARLLEKLGLQVELRSDPGEDLLEPSTRILLYQAARELLFNVVKHSGTLKARVDIKTTDDQLVLVVSDQGMGFDAAAVMRDSSRVHGLLEIQKKVSMLGCSMKIESKPGSGTSITISAPVQRNDTR